MHPEDIARTNQRYWRINLSATTGVRQLIAKPPEGFVHRINWWQKFEMASSGDFSVSERIFLLEGPLPEGATEQDLGNGVSALRNEGTDALHVLMISRPSGDASTQNNSAADGYRMFPFPKGIWTVEDIYAGWVTLGGVEEHSASIGFNRFNIGIRHWEQLRRHSPNTSFSGEVIA